MQYRKAAIPPARAELVLSWSIPPVAIFRGAPTLAGRIAAHCIHKGQVDDEGIPLVTADGRSGSVAGGRM